jgi:hypothetical protein
MSSACTICHSPLRRIHVLDRNAAEEIPLHRDLDTKPRVGVYRNAERRSNASSIAAQDYVKGLSVALWLQGPQRKRIELRHDRALEPS